MKRYAHIKIQNMKPLIAKSGKDRIRTGLAYKSDDIACTDSATGLALTAHRPAHILRTVVKLCEIALRRSFHGKSNAPGII